jgi:hypothetical protein
MANARDRLPTSASNPLDRSDLPRPTLSADVLKRRAAIEPVQRSNSSGGQLWPAILPLVRPTGSSTSELGAVNL